MRIAIITTDTRENIRAAFHNGPATAPGIGFAPESLLQGFAHLPEVEVHVVSCLKAALPSPERIAPNIFYHGVAVPQTGWLRTLYQGCIRGIRKKLREIRPAIVHGQGTERYCAISAAFSGYPNVVTIHGNMRLIAAINRSPCFSHPWLAARLERFTLPHTDGVVCITRYTQSAVAGLARKTWVLPNAVDESFFEVQPSPDQDLSSIGLCVGMICPRKNQNAFIRALDSLAEQRPFKILFAGEPESTAYGEEFRQLIRARPWCKHIGFLNREQLKARLTGAAFLALPTVEDNCPMVVLEAMAAGVPVMASNVGGVPDLVQHEVNGLLCEPERPETFHLSIARLLDDRELATRIAIEAKAQAQRRFHPQVIARQHLEIYHEVIHSKNA